MKGQLQWQRRTESVYPCSTTISAPSAFIPSICISTALTPIAQPPGKDTFASPNLPSKEPNSKTDALIFFTKSYSATIFVILEQSIVVVLFVSFFSILQPMSVIKAVIDFISCMSGKFLSITGLSHNKAPAIIAKPEFLDPDTSISPFSTIPPSLISFCIKFF